MGLRGFVAAIVGAGTVLLATGTAHAQDYAPLDQPGPAYTATPAQLAGSLKCTPGVANATREPVLLLPATGVDSDQNYGFNYEIEFKNAGIPYCTSDQPGKDASNMGDIQTRADYVTYAIRKEFAMAGRKVAIVGHSQGGMAMRWSLRFWPDTRAMVSDVVGMAGSNHGTLSAQPVCVPGCAPSVWQQKNDSKFTAALNSGTETFGGIDYTEVYTHLDEVVTPNLDSPTGSSSLRGGDGRIANVATQDVCPTDAADHLLVGTTDAVASALVFDALGHDGPADPARIDTSVCTQPLPPGLDPATTAAAAATSFSQLGAQFASYPTVPAEPALRCYVTASCPGGGAGPGAGEGAPSSGAPASSKTCASRRAFTVHVDLRGALRGLKVTLDGKRLKTSGRSGHRTVRVDLRGAKKSTATLKLTGRRGGKRVTRTLRYSTCTKR